MQAQIGDRLHVHSKIVGQADHLVEVIEVRGADGAPPYLVRHDDGREALMFPGPDTSVEHSPGSA